MVTTRNGKRTAAEAPAAAANTKKQKLPVRAKEGKTAASKKDETSRSSSSSKKRSSFVVELKSEAGAAKGAQDVKEQQIITGAEQPAPRTDADEIGDSDASPESVGDDAHEAAEQLAAEANTALVAEGGGDDDDSDSDAAPEAVSTSKAAVQAKKSAQAANKAIAE